MLAHRKMGEENLGLGQLRPDFSGLGDVKRIRTDAQRALAARYIIILVGGAMLLWLVAHMFGIGGALSFSHTIRVVLVAVMGPIIVWFASERELRLLRELETRNKQLKQRVQEVTALNRMTQAHLSECYSFPDQRNVVEEGRGLTVNNTHAEQQPIEVAAD